MKFSVRGMATTKKIVLTIALALVIAGGIYVALGSGRPGVVPNGSQSGSSSSSTALASFSGGAGQPKSILDLFGNFSRMVVTIGYLHFADGEVQSQGESHFSYSVLGQAVLNSTNYYKVQFTDLDSKKSGIAWFNQMGLVDRVDILGDKNYTGTSASVYAQAFTAPFSLIPNLSHNATLLSGLQKTAEGTQNVGPTQMNVITYRLAAPSPAYSNYTLKIATVPGTSTKLAVYWYVEDPSTSNALFEVTSVTRA
jgi:hypothetical protein